MNKSNEPAKCVSDGGITMSWARKETSQRNRERAAEARNKPLAAFAMAALAAGLLLSAGAGAQTSAAGADHWQPFNVTTNPTGKGCSGCHGASPSTNRANAAGSTGNVTGGASIIAAAVTNTAVTGMGSISLTQTQRESLALYIESVINTTPLAVSVSFNTAKTQSLTGKVYMDSSATLLNVLETDPTDVPGKGSVSYDDDSSPGFTYTPTTGQCGSDTFKYRARRSATGLVTSSRTVNITIASPGNTDITNASNNKAGTYGTNLSYTITASNSPLSYSHSGTLPPGITRSGATFSGSPDAVGQWSVTMSATNCANTDSETLIFDIAKANQTVTIPSQGTLLYRPDTQYTITGTSSTSGLSSFTYASVTPTICTIASGATINKLAVGTCIVTATQAGNANYNADTSAQRSIIISKASQSIDFPTQTTASRAFSLTPFSISPTATATSGLAVTYTSDTTGVCTVSGTSVTMVAAGLCTLRANQDGDSNWNPALDTTENVTITSTLPNPPTGIGASPGDTQASITFTPPTNNGGMPITGYTASCITGGQSAKTGTAASSPVTVSTLTNGLTYSCTVFATTAAGNSAVSSSVNVIPTATPVAPAFTSTAAATFTINSAGTFNVTASGVPVPAFSLFSGSMPSGMSLTSGGVLSGTPALGTTSGDRTLTIRATNSAGTADQSFTLTINKASQTISFTNPGAQSFSASTIPLTASASSGLAVALTVDASATSICSVSGANVIMLSVGQCVINANQAGDGNYSAALQVQRSFAINQGTQTINFPAQSPSTQAFSPGGTFPLSPAGTASSGLAVTHTSVTPAVCTVSGTTVTIVDIGICTIQAAQAGNANYQEATEVQRNVTITMASQTITFAATQPAQNYSPSGTFALDPLGTASSSLPVTYSSTTPGVCTILDRTITIVSVGTCTIAADQAGDAQYSAAVQVTRNITISAVVPGAPTIGTATAGNGQASIAFDPPTSDGGSPITGYTATCNPGSVSGNGTESPVSVTGLTNNVAYTCSVTATNVAGTSPPSGTVMVTPVSSTGAALWTNTCSACHGAVPAGARFNAAGTTATVLAYVRTNQPSMALTPAVQALSNSDLEALAAYIAQQVPAISVTTAVNTARTISVASHLTLNTISFTSVEVITGPSNGMLSAFAGRNVTYTPNPGFTGVDTFTYRGKRTSPSSVLGDPRTVTITVTASTVSLSINMTGTGFGNVTSSPFGISCGLFCSEVFAPGTVLTLTAVPEEGFGFGGWSGVSCTEGNSSPTCTFTLNTGTTVSAAFTDDPALPDFNADNKPDILWRHTPSGSLYVWHMDGVNLISDALITSVDPIWKMDGIADFNGDGHPDIVWRNGAGDTYVWYLVNGVFQSDAFLFSLPPEWVIQGVADFNADGKPDFLMRNTNSGNAFAWFFNDNVAIGDQFLFNIDPSWKVEGIGDFNQDGQPDLLFRNVSSGLAFAWNSEFSGGNLSLTTSSPPIFSIDSFWEVVQVADWNADGKPDLLFRNKDTGVVFVWYLDGVTLTTSDFIIQIDPSWEIVPRR